MERAWRMHLYRMVGQGVGLRLEELRPTDRPGG